MSARRTLARPDGPTASGRLRLSPLSGNTVTEPVRRRSPALATTTEPSPRPPARGTPGQYQADERADAGAARGTWALIEVAPPIAGRFTRASITPPATTRATRTVRAGSRRVRPGRSVRSRRRC